MADKDLEFETQADAASAGPSIALSPEREAEYERILRNLQEATSTDIIRKVLAEDRTVRCYWGELAALNREDVKVSA